jgi:hypothetical protein
MAQSYYALSHTFNVGSGGSTRVLDITSGGRILMGTTSDDGSSLLQVNGNLSIAAGFSLKGGSVEMLVSDGSAIYLKTGSQLYIQNGSTTVATISNTGAATFNATLKTGAPTGGTAKPWKLGKIYTDPCGVPTTFGQTLTDKYIEVEIDGVFCYIPIRVPGWC